MITCHLRNVKHRSVKPRKLLSGKRPVNANRSKLVEHQGNKENQKPTNITRRETPEQACEGLLGGGSLLYEERKMNNAIILSESFYWPPHYDFAGKRCEDTLAAICQWDGVELNQTEKKILKLSTQTELERKCLIAYINNYKPETPYRKIKEERLSRYNQIRNLRSRLGLVNDEGAIQYIHGVCANQGTKEKFHGK